MRAPRLADQRLRRPAFKNDHEEFLEVSRGSADQAVPNEEDLELGPETNWKPVNLASNAGRDMGEFRFP